MNKIISHLLVIPMSISFLIYAMVANVKNKSPLFNNLKYFKKLSWMDKVNDIEKLVVEPIIKTIKERKQK